MVPVYPYVDFISQSFGNHCRACFATTIRCSLNNLEVVEQLPQTRISRDTDCTALLRARVKQDNIALVARIVGGVGVRGSS